MWRVRVKGAGNIHWDWFFTKEANALKFARQLMKQGYCENKDGGDETRMWNILEVFVQPVE